MKTKEIYFNETMTGIKRKTYLWEQEGLPPSDFWKSIIQTGSTRQAKNHLKQLFPGVPTPSLFDTPKPEKLLQYILELASSPGDFVLDCFAGSGTTAAVAQKMGRRWVTCELNEDTFERFTKPRLLKVIYDQDPGEISRSEGERIAAEGVDLPEGVSPIDAQKFTSILNKIISENNDLKKSDVVKELKALTKTKKTKEIINWRGGGGFNIARLSPTCFIYDEKIKRVNLTEYATGFTLIASVAAHLRFELTPGHPYFDGIRGRMRLKVYEGVLTVDEVDFWTLHLAPEEKLLFAVTGIMDGVREHIRNKKIGSSVVHIPDDLFTFEEGGDN